MGKNKPRTATHRVTNILIEKYSKECELWDGGFPECLLPWSHSSKNGCNGNPFVCKKLYMKYLASTKEPDQRIIDIFENRNTNNK